MALTYITITGTFDDGSGNPLSGQVIFTPSQTVYASGIPVASTTNPVIVQVISGSLQTVKLLSTSNAGLTFAGLTGFFTWSVQITLGGVTQPGWSFFLPLTPTTVDLYSLANTAVASSLYVPLAGGTMTGALSTPDLVVQGLTGATAASRYVGATASGSPASGTFAVGDFVIDQSGAIWICTVAGTPGTWVKAGPTIPVSIAQGGTGQTTANAAFGALAPLTTLGDIIYENATPAAARLAGNTSATKNFLTQTGSGSVSAAPAWGTIGSGDISAFALLKANNLSDLASIPAARQNLAPWLFDITAAAYGALGNGQVITDGAITGGQAVLTTVGIAAPSAPTVANAGTGGTILAGTYQVEITYVNQFGETVASSSTSTTTSGSTSTITITGPGLSGNATGWYAYVTQAGGSSFTRQQTPGNPTPIGQNLVLTAPPSSGGASPPGSNTTKSTLFTAGDVGKTVIVNGATGTASAQVFTVSSFTSSSSITLSGNATTTVTGAIVLWWTDDTAAIQAAINAAAAYANTHGYAMIYKPQAPGGTFYGISGALSNAGDANSQLVIPEPPAAGIQPVLHFYAPTGPVPLNMWTMAYPQVANALVSSGLFASGGAQTTNENTWGPASVLGAAPAIATDFPQLAGLPAFSNISVVAENWNIVTPQSNGGLNYSAYGMLGTGKSQFLNCAALITTNYQIVSGANQVPATGNLAGGASRGFIPSGNSNNDQAMLRAPAVVGYSYAFQLGEHAYLEYPFITSTGYIARISGNDGAAGGHLIKIIGMSVGSASWGFLVVGNGLGGTGFMIDADVDVESLNNNSVLLDAAGTGANIATLQGEIRLYGSFGVSIMPTAWPTRCHIVNKTPAFAGIIPGWVFAYAGFSGAGSGVAVQNPYGRDAFIIVSGGTVTAISAGVTLGGSGGSATTAPAMTATGLTSGTIPWPSLAWLSITQTGNPTVNVCIPS